MKKDLYLILISGLLTMMVSSSTCAMEETEQTETNKDGSVIELTSADCDSNKKCFSLSYKKSAQKNSHRIFYHVGEQSESMQLMAKLVDLDKDGFFDLEIYGFPAPSRGDLFLFDPRKKEFYHFYSGGSSGLELSGGYLIDSGRSSCCAWESSVYKIPLKQTLIRSEMVEFLIEISTVVDNKVSRLPHCKFFRPDGEIIRPPGKRWLKYCRIYGEHFTIEEPKQTDKEGVDN